MEKIKDDKNNNNQGNNGDKNEEDDPKIYGVKKLIKMMILKNTSKLNAKKTTILDLDPSCKQTLIKIDFTLSNTFLLYSDGQVFSKGKGEALGRKKDEKEKEKEKDKDKSKNIGEVQFIIPPNSNLNIPISDNKIIIYNISAGDNHVLALDNSLQVWGWGENKYHQVLPKSDIKVIEAPVIIQLSIPVIVSQIFAYKTSSFVVCQKNQVISWGSINTRATMGRNKNKKEGETSSEFFRYEQVTSFISDQMFKDTSDYTDAFINTRKMLNSKYAQGAKEDDDHKEREKNLQNKKKQLIADIEARQKETKLFASSLTDKHNDKRITILQELIKVYEHKITKIASQKEKLRKDLSRIDEELTEEHSDLKNNKALIDKVETDIENIYNDITTYESKNQNMRDKLQNINQQNSIKNDTISIQKSVNHNNTQQIMQDNANETCLIVDMQKKIRNMEIFKESLNKNLQVISTSIDSKEKEHSLISSAINKITDKENDYLQARYTIEDMIQVLFEARMNKNKEFGNAHQFRKNINSNTIHEKIREINKQLLDLNTKAEKLSFAYLNMLYPYKITNDILIQSSNDIAKIEEELEKLISQQSETVKNDLKIIYELLQSRLQLILQQNHMIKIIYVLLSSLKESDVTNYYQDKTKMKESLIMMSGKNDYKDNIEYVYKDVIIELLKETYWITKEEEKIEERDEEIVERERETYLNERIETMKKLRERNYQGILARQEEKLLDDVVSYDNHNQIDEPKSNWNWNSFSSISNNLSTMANNITSSSSTPTPGNNTTATPTPGSSWNWQTPFNFK